MKEAALLSLALALTGCSDLPSHSSEAAWGRGQCGQIVDVKMREKCLQRVDSEYRSR